jgi:hypothetical protein
VCVCECVCVCVCVQLAAALSASTGKTVLPLARLWSTCSCMAAALSASTGKTVEYVTVQLPYDAVKASFIEKGWPAWQVGGLLELFRAVDAGAYGFGLGDYNAITGKEPTTVAQFVEGHWRQ